MTSAIASTAKKTKQIVLGTLLAFVLASTCAFVSPSYAYASVSDQFNDVYEGNWSTSHIQWVYDAGIMTGYNDWTFGSSSSLTRAELATILWRQCLPEAAANYAQEYATNRTNMYDVVDGAYYTEAINWAYENGIFTGYLRDNGYYEFCGDNAITREEAITVIWRYLDGNWPSNWSLFDVYPDTDQVSDWANWAMGWAISNGIINGTKKTNGYYIEPTRAVTREEIAKILHTSITGEGRETISIIALRAYRELQLGKWYEWGAAGPDTFDCSGLVGYCCTGIYGDHWCWTGSIINWNRVSNPQVGDICVVHNSSHQHCGIYIGDGQYINAPGTGKQIRINDVPSYMVYVRY